MQVRSTLDRGNNLALGRVLRYFLAMMPRYKWLDFFIGDPRTRFGVEVGEPIFLDRQQPWEKVIHSMNTYLLLAEDGEKEAENVEARADVDVVGLVGVDTLRSRQNLLEGCQLEVAVGPHVRLQSLLEN